jgi:hypothetical protein
MLPIQSQLLLTLLPLTSLIPTTFCWGSLGHRTVAYLASEYLTTDATAYTTDLLNGQDISEASLWPDKIRRLPMFSFTAGWHYIDAEDDPPRNCGVKLKRDCDRRAGCVVSAIANQTERLVRPTSSHADKGEAIRFLLHFFGDIHQPLHTEAEGRGGNDIDVLFGKKRTNLHSVWDTSIPEKRAGGEGTSGDEEKVVARAWAKELRASDVNAAECRQLDNATACALAYADEANQWVCDYVLKDDVAGVEGKDLSGAYYEGAAPVVDLLIAKAGKRLAAWINALAKNASASTTTTTRATDAMIMAKSHLDAGRVQVEELLAVQNGL